MNNNEMLADISEAIESLKFYRPVYFAILKATGSRQQAVDAINFLKKIEEGGI